MPASAFKKSIDEVTGEIYGVADASSGRTPFGSAQWSSLSSDNSTMKYLAQGDIARYLPRALEIIVEDARAREEALKMSPEEKARWKNYEERWARGEFINIDELVDKPKKKQKRGKN